MKTKNVKLIKNGYCFDPIKSIHCLLEINETESYLKKVTFPLN